VRKRDKRRLNDGLINCTSDQNYVSSKMSNPVVSPYLLSLLIASDTGAGFS